MADVVNVGTTANDGNGDTLRSAFSQINARFNTIAGTLTGGDAWAAGVSYTSTPVRNWVVNAGQAYVAASNHVSGATFAADLAAGKWLAVDVAQLIADLAASSGSSLVGYMPAGVGAVPRTVEQELRRNQLLRIVVTDAPFYAKGDGVTDDTAAIQAAIDYASNNNDPISYGSNSPANGSCTVYFPAGYYKVTAPLVVTKKIAIEGEGQSEFSSGSRVLQFNPAFDLFRINPIASGMSFSIENMVLRHNGSGAGYLVNTTRTSAMCNSQRYVNCTFGPPALSAVKVIGDDVEFLNCLFDVGQGSACIQLGTNTPGETASAVRVIGCNFFQQTTRVFLAFQIDGLTVTGCCNYSDGSSRTMRFFDAIDSLPLLVKNITITGNTIKHARCVFGATSAIDTVISGNTCTLLGNGVGENNSAITLTGNTNGLVINGNLFNGTFDLQQFYSDAGGPVVNANITGNVFKNAGGTGNAFQISNTLGVIDNNHLTGFTAPQLSQSVAFSSLLPTGQVLSPGAGFSETVTIIGAIVGDAVSVSAGGSLALGIVRFAYVSSLNTVTINYVNTSAIVTGQGVEALKIKVSR